MKRQTEDGRHSAVGTLVGAGFKPALVPHARCNRIAVISRELKVGRTISDQRTHRECQTRAGLKPAPTRAAIVLEGGRRIPPRAHQPAILDTAFLSASRNFKVKRCFRLSC